MRMLPFETVSHFHNHLARVVTEESLTEDHLMAHLETYAEANDIDPGILRENYLAYALVVQLESAGLLDEVMASVMSESLTSAEIN
jgi:hypothetical protein